MHIRSLLSVASDVRRKRDVKALRASASARHLALRPALSRAFCERLSVYHSMHYRKKRPRTLHIQYDSLDLATMATSPAPTGTAADENPRKRGRFEADVMSLEKRLRQLSARGLKSEIPPP
jgi:hypothetical protein